jgi:uncharacterized protein (DUF362 family)
MAKSLVALTRYERPEESVRAAVELCSGLDHLSSTDRVFIKPNIVFWAPSVPFPKWGVITTSRVIEDMVILLKERGVSDISIGEGMCLFNPKDKQTPAEAFESLGYNVLAQRYGVKAIDIHQRPFEKVDLGDGVTLNCNADYLNSDFVVNIPVLKTHAQTIVSLGIKNLKGLIDVNSRRRCHNADPEKDLHFWVSKLADKLPRSLTILDGVFTIERGPGFDGKARRSNVLVASSDVLAADKVGAKLLGYEPAQIPYLVHAAKSRKRPIDLSDVEIKGEPIESLAAPHQFTFLYNETNTLPIPMEKMGIEGFTYPKYDTTICTYCSVLSSAILIAVGLAWKGEPWADVEVLTGKIMKPTPGKKTILLGKCLFEANKSHPDFGKMIAVKSCPPSRTAIIKALQQVGIDVNPVILENLEQVPALSMKRYEGKPEFDASFFTVT